MRPHRRQTPWPLLQDKQLSSSPRQRASTSRAGRALPQRRLWTSRTVLQRGRDLVVPKPKGSVFTRVVDALPDAFEVRLGEGGAGLHVRRIGGPERKPNVLRLRGVFSTVPLPNGLRSVMPTTRELKSQRMRWTNCRCKEPVRFTGRPSPKGIVLTVVEQSVRRQPLLSASP